jgi:polysaccharide deacetylase family protein (PEP-CTERM system associated)
MADGDRRVSNILTLDIEDWRQSSPEVFSASGASLASSAPGARVLQNTRKLLRILGEHKARATCFVLGSVAEAFPDLVREIQDAGHEIASHGYHHLPVYFRKPEEFKADVARSLECLENVIGKKVRGYRAPYFSITRGTRWALPILAQLGLEYDASFFPLHRRYYRFPGWEGAEDAERFPFRLAFGDRHLLELPITTARVLGQNLPISGGVFLGFVPPGLFRWCIRKTNRLGHPAILYLHPHDLDLEELRRPRPEAALRKRLFQKGLNIGRRRNEEKLRRLLSEFYFTSIHEWLKGNPIPA